MKDWNKILARHLIITFNGNSLLPKPYFDPHAFQRCTHNMVFFTNFFNLDLLKDTKKHLLKSRLISRQRRADQNKAFTKKIYHQTQQQVFETNFFLKWTVEAQNEFFSYRKKAKLHKLARIKKRLQHKGFTIKYIIQSLKQTFWKSEPFRLKINFSYTDKKPNCTYSAQMRADQNKV